ncbi:MAG: hypothetical protein WCT08_01000 [Patescibacteria group bacterium]|jgi:hypothetical protein
MRRFSGVLIIIISTIIGFGVILGWSFRLSILKSETWKEALQQAKIYDHLVSDLTVSIIDSSESKNEVLANAPVTSAEAADLVNAVITPVYLQTQVEKTLDLTFDIIFSRTDFNSAKLEIPLQDIKNRLPVAVQELLIKKINKLPICTTAQLKEFEKQKTLDTVLPPCKPKGMDARSIVNESLKIEEITKQIPETIDIIAEIKKTQEDSDSQNSLNEVIVKIQDIAKLSLKYHLFATCIWLGLLVILFLIFLPSLRRCFRWFSIGLFIPNFLLIIGASVGRNRISEITIKTDATNEILVRNITPIIQNLATQTVSQVQKLALIGLVASLVLFAIQFVWPPKKSIK